MLPTLYCEHSSGILGDDMAQDAGAMRRSVPFWALANQTEPAPRATPAPPAIASFPPTRFVWGSIRKRPSGPQTHTPCSSAAKWNGTTPGTGIVATIVLVAG